MSEGQISTPAPEIADQFTQFLQQEGVIESSEGSEEISEPEEPVAVDALPEESEEELPVEAEAEAEVSVDAEADAEADSDPDSINTLSDLALAFEVEEQEFVEHLQIPSRDGEGTVSLSEVINAYHTQPADNEEARQHYENLGTNLRSEHDAKLLDMQKLTAAMIAQVDNEPNVDWDMLRQSDPGEYLRERETRDARRSDIQRSLNAMDGEMKRREEEAAVQHQSWQQEQVSTLYRLRPDWKEPEAGRSAMTEVSDYLRKGGFDDQEISGLEDARSILTVWRAAQWEKLQAKKPGVKKRLSLLPRTLRAGARDDAGALSNEQEAEKVKSNLRGRLSETGSVDDAAALIRGML